MPQVKNEFPLDDEMQEDSDPSFKGFSSRFQPTILPPQILASSGNMRLDRGTARVRAGLYPQSSDISLTNPPLVLDFSLAPDVGISSITRSAGTATVTTLVAHGYNTLDYVNIRGAAQTDYNGDYTITKTGATTFTYTVLNTPVTPATGMLVANKGPRIFNNYATSCLGSCGWADNDNNEGIVLATTSNAYLYRPGQSTLLLTYPGGETVSTCDLVMFQGSVFLFRGYQLADQIGASSLTSTGTTATFTALSAHGRTTNDYVQISGAAPGNYNGIFQITVTGATAFTYTISGAPTSPAVGTIFERPVQAPMIWNGQVATPTFALVTLGANALLGTYINMPAVDWGDFFKQRMVLPYARDQIILSDILSPQSYDLQYSQLRILPGTKDWLVAVHPWQDVKLMVFYRHSIHMLILDGTNLSISQSIDITRDIGCFARKTLTTCGDSVLWLSDVGVMKINITDYITPISLTLPLSDPIQDQMANINWTYAQNSVGAYYNNRYYLAAPLGTSQTLNQTIFVYNFLINDGNGAWESVDTYPAGFDVQKFHILQYNGQNRLFAIATNGYVFLMEQGSVDTWGSPGNTMNYTIAGNLTTRSYFGDTYELVKFRRFMMDTSLETADAFSVTLDLINPDKTVPVFNYTALATDAVSHRKQLLGRGANGQISITTSAGRPEFRAIRVQGSYTSENNLTYT